MAAEWDTVDTAADATGVASLARRLKSGRRDARADEGGRVRLLSGEAPPRPSVRQPPVPQPSGPRSEDATPPLPRPPLCTLPPASPLPEPMKSPPPPAAPRKDASASAPAFDWSARLAGADDDFASAIEADLREIRGRARRDATAAPAAALPAVAMPAMSRPAGTQVLDLAHPLHAELQDAKRAQRATWLGMALLVLAVIGGVVWTTVRLDRADRLIAKLIEQLDTERTLASTYKQEVTRLYQSLSDSRAQEAKLAARAVQQKEPQRQRPAPTSNAAWKAKPAAKGK